jgi:hypothetical protein
MRSCFHLRSFYALTNSVLQLLSSIIELKGPLQPTKTPKDEEPSDLFDRKLFEWQKSRLERQLKGEYKSKVFRLNELVSPLNTFHPKCIPES